MDSRNDTEFTGWSITSYTAIWCPRCFKDWIPVFTGMTEEVEPGVEAGADRESKSRFYVNPAS